jgi:hypothetical protein
MRNNVDVINLVVFLSNTPSSWFILKYKITNDLLLDQEYPPRNAF